MPRNGGQACVDCGAPTDAVFGLCPDCVAAVTRAECEAQGVPFVIDDPLAYERLGGLFRSAAAMSSPATIEPAGERPACLDALAAQAATSERPSLGFGEVAEASARSNNNTSRRRLQPARAQGSRRVAAEGR